MTVSRREQVRAWSPAGPNEPVGNHGRRAPIGCTPKRDTSQPTDTKAQLKAAKQPFRSSQWANAECRRSASWSGLAIIRVPISLQVTARHC